MRVVFAGAGGCLPWAGEITFNGQDDVPVVSSGPTSKAQCKHGGWKSFTSPSFKNQGQCVSWFEHHVLNHGHGR
ncbi:MAG TPA: hypothetical protein VKP14_04690 [Gaiellaceae bacterium]|nr:hypothetical protein [Gaiellaceae bacterium]